MYACYFLKVHLLNFSKKIIKKSQNSRNRCFSYYFCLMMEGSGSGSIFISLTHGSGRPSYGSGSGWGSRSATLVIIETCPHRGLPLSLPVCVQSAGGEPAALPRGERQPGEQQPAGGRAGHTRQLRQRWDRRWDLPAVAAGRWAAAAAALPLARVPAERGGGEPRTLEYMHVPHRL